MKCGELWVPHQLGSTRHLFCVVSSSINKLLVYGLAVSQPGSAGSEKGQIACLVVCACLCVHADMHLKKAILKSGPNLLFSCAVVCYFNHISDQTGKGCMSGFMQQAYSCQHCCLTTDTAARMLGMANKWHSEIHRFVARQYMFVCMCFAPGTSQNNRAHARETSLVFHFGGRWFQQWR